MADQTHTGLHWHSSTPAEIITGIDAHLFSIKTGAAMVWHIGPVAVGPEIWIEAYPWQTPGVDRCRKITSNPVVPNIGLRIEF